MSIGLLHISDIHFRSKNDLEKINVKALKNAIYPSLLSIEELLIVVTGDIAFSGTEEQYVVAESFFNLLKTELKDKQVYFVLVPGNHNCDFSREIPGRESVIEFIKQKQEVKTKDIPLISEVQKNYNIFTKKIECLNTEFGLFKQYKLQLQGKEILLTGINTAWMSLKKETKEIIFPESELENLKKSLNEIDSYLNIAFFHHNYNWQSHRVLRDFKEVIDMKYDFILTGHEHCSSQEKRTSGDYTTEHFEGMSLLGEEINGFNLIILDLEKKRRRFYSFIKDQKYDIYKKIEKDDSWKSLEIKSKDHKKLKDKFYEELNLLDLPLIDNCGDIIQLEDIYIFPQLQDMSNKEEKKNYRNDVKDSKELLKTSNTGKYLFIGGNRCGKTSFARMIFKKFLRKNMYPVYISGKKIKKYDIDSFEKLVTYNYGEQYVEDKCFFEQLDFSERVVIIDDFGSNHNPELSELFENIIKSYPNLFIIVDEGFYIETLSKVKDEIREELKIYKIREFGNVKRNEMIEKWNNITKEKCQNNFDRNKKTSNFINSIIKKNIIPSNPSYLLTSLDAFEKNLKSAKNIENTSYGYYYECIIIALLSRLKNNLGQDDVDSYFTFLKLLSFELYKNKKDFITKEEIKKIHDNYIEEYEISPEQEMIYYLNKLMDSLKGIYFIEEKTSKIYFKYPYLYYFFLAKYFCMDDTDSFSYIQDMIKNISDTDNFNILLFVIYNKNTIKIFNEILNTVKSIHSTQEEIKFQEDIDLISKIQESILDERKFSDEDFNAENNIKKRGQRLDEIDYLSEDPKESDIKDYKTEERTEERTEENIENIFKYVELIGCILRSYSGSLKGDIKYDLCREGYSVILRTLNLFVASLSKGYDEMMEQVTARIKQIEQNDNIKLSNSKKEEEIKKMIYFIVSMASYLFIKRASKLLGNNKISKTYQKIKENYGTKAGDIFDFSLTLEIVNKVPFEKLDAIYKNDKNNKFCDEIIKMMMLDYLAFNPTTSEEKKKVFKKFNITMEEQLKMENKNKLKDF